MSKYKGENPVITYNGKPFIIDDTTKIKCKALDTVGSSLEICADNNIVGMVPLSLITEYFRDYDGCIEALIIPTWLAKNRGFVL